MGYLPQWWPDSEGKLHFLTTDISGVYDQTAIRYGYSQVMNDDPLYVPAELQIDIDNKRLLFHTDENVDQDRILSYAHRNSMKDALFAPRKWMQAFALYRTSLFQDPNEHLRDVRRTFFFLTSITEAVTNVATYVNGYTTDYRRNKLIPDDHTNTVVQEIVEFLVGDTWRLDDIANHLTSTGVDEGGRMTITDRPWQGSYTIDKAQLPVFHLKAVVQVARALLIPQRVAQLPDPGAFLLRLITTPSTRSKRTILQQVMDHLQLEAITGLFSTVEYYRESYPITTQTALDTAIDHVTGMLSGEQHRTVVSGVVRTLRLVQERNLLSRKEPRSCGKPHTVVCCHSSFI